MKGYVFLLCFDWMARERKVRDVDADGRDEDGRDVGPDQTRGSGPADTRDSWLSSAAQLIRGSASAFDLSWTQSTHLAKMNRDQDIIRRPEQFSPKSSPRGSRSPVIPRQDSTGTLKTTISLGKTPTIVHSAICPFYLMKADAPAESELTGATNLIVYHNLEHSYSKFCLGRKLKDSLSSFLPNLPGNIDFTVGPNDTSTLRSLIEKPPITGKELIPLTASQLTGFRLHPGPLPEQYRLMHTANTFKKHKKKKRSKGQEDSTPSHDGSAQADGYGLDSGPGPSSHEKKHGKKRKHDDEREKERKKKKKEKKRKRQRHSPEPGANGSQAVPGGLLGDRSV